MNKRAVTRITAAAVAAVFATGFTACGAADAKKETTSTTTTTTKAVSQVSNTDTIDTQDVDVDITTDEGWTDESTPVILHIATTDSTVDFYHAVSPSEDNIGSDMLSLAPTDYAVTIISPINADGSVYSSDPDTASVVSTSVITVADNDDTDAQGKVDANLHKIPAEEVTDDTITGIIDEIGKAVANGDDTLTGDKGQKVIDTAVKNTSEAPNVSDDIKDTVKETAENTIVVKNDDEATPTIPTAPKADTAPATEAPKADTTPATEAPKADTTPATETPKADTDTTPATEAPTTSGRHWVVDVPGHYETKTVTVGQHWEKNIVTIVDEPERTDTVWVAGDGVDPDTGEEVATFADGTVVWGHDNIINYSDTHPWKDCGKLSDGSELIAMMPWDCGYSKTVTVPAVTHEEDQGQWVDDTEEQQVWVEEQGHWEN